MNDQNIASTKPRSFNKFIPQTMPVVISIIVCVFILFLISVAGDYYLKKPFTNNKKTNPIPAIIKEKACSQEAKICPDGSSVGRSGPNCDFTPCPNSNIKSKPNYSCPKNGWVNCMPILTDEAKKLCQPEAINWYIANCPGFKGMAQ